MSKKSAVSILGVIIIFSLFSFFSFAKTNSLEGERVVTNDGVVQGTLEPRLEIEKVGKRDYKAIFTVKNQTERSQTIIFRSGQKFDYILYRNNNKVTQYSEGKFFTQVYQEVVLKQGEELQFTEVFANLEKGQYELIFWLADRNWPNVKAKAAFIVE